MKRISTIFVGLAVILTVEAQTLYLSSDTIFITGYADAYEIIAHSTIHNSSSAPVDVKWVRTQTLASGWEGTSICDGNECYLPSISISPIPFTIPANGESLFDVHFKPSDIPGSGTVQLRAWVVGDSANTVVVGTYKATAEEPVGVTASQVRENIRIYPNPAKDYILIKNLPQNEVSTVEVYNIFGRRMLSFSQAPNAVDNVHKFDINVLAKGIYMIRVFDAAMNVIFSESLSKE